jgi:hypothetical protein
MRVPRQLLAALYVLVVLALVTVPAAGAAASVRTSKPASTASPKTARVTLAMGGAFHGGGVLTGARLYVNGGASYQHGRLSLPVANVTVAPSGKRAILALAGSVRLTARGHQLVLAKLQVRFGPQGNVTFSTKLSGGGRAGVFTGMANSSPVTASGVSATSAPVALGDAGNRLIAKLLRLPVEEVQAQFIGNIKIPAVAASRHAGQG